MGDVQENVQEELFKQYCMNLEGFRSLLTFMLALFGFIIALFTFTVSMNVVSESIFSNPNNWLLYLFVGFMIVAFYIVIFNIIGTDKYDKLTKSSSGNSIIFKEGSALQNNNVNLYSKFRNQKSLYGTAVFGIAFSLLCLFIYFMYFKTDLGSNWGVASGVVFFAYLIFSLFRLYNS